MPLLELYELYCKNSREKASTQNFTLKRLLSHTTLSLIAI